MPIAPALSAAKIVFNFAVLGLLHGLAYTVDGMLYQAQSRADAMLLVIKQSSGHGPASATPCTQH